MNAKKKLSPAQNEIMELLCNGWQIGYSTSTYSRVFIQKGGVGKGGESKKIGMSSFECLRRERLIEHVKGTHLPCSKYNASEKKP